MKNDKKPDKKETDQIMCTRVKLWGRVVTVSIKLLFVYVLIGCTNSAVRKEQLDQQRLLDKIDREARKLRDLEREEARRIMSAAEPPKEELGPLSNKAASYLTYHKAQMFLSGYKPRKYVDNKFTEKTINDGEVVTDQATDLVWQQSGSIEKMTRRQAGNYINRLNREGFAGYGDWRLPTLEEVVSLLEQDVMNGDLHVSAVFNKKQRLVWTSDLKGTWLAWVVHFSSGGCSFSNFNDSLYVRAVRFGQ
ncbi:MAG: DUF1566 domain-containing protein [Planctomycetes bacterium]|nr:DUF1566 domain-containing protein [Planctomycetota bacterium]